MKSIILKTASTYLLPLLLLFAVFILLRGHYNPGGGFVGGLIASIAFVLHAFAHGLANTRKMLRFVPSVCIPVGLATSLLSGFVPMAMGRPFMSAEWLSVQIPIIGSIGTPLFFDIGVFLVVIGITLTILFTISDGIL